MHKPSYVQSIDTTAHDFMREFRFASLIGANSHPNHLPLTLVEEEGAKGLLCGHFERANEHGQALDGTEVLAVFNRPNAYISLRWYVSSPAVATWNYAVVHVHGRLSILGSSELDQVLMTIVHQYEPDLIGNSSLMPQSHLDKLKSAIVGFGTSIESIQAKFKLGQKRSSADQMGVYVYLFRSTNLDDQQLSLFLKNTLKFN